MVRISLLSVYGLPTSYHIHKKVITFNLPNPSLVEVRLIMYNLIIFVQNNGIITPCNTLQEAFDHELAHLKTKQNLKFYTVGKDKENENN